MTNMLEKVARAIANELQGGDWQDFMPAARAAVSAMREPSDEMLEAAMPGLPDYADLPDDWRAMISYVLNE